VGSFSQVILNLFMNLNIDFVLIDLFLEFHIFLDDNLGLLTLKIQFFL